MKSFKTYTPKKEQKSSASAEELVAQLTAAYDGKSNAQMLKSVLAEAEKSKRAGTLSNAEIDAFYNAFAPMVDGSQRKKLQEIVEKLKKI